jgi:hypothetical protein
MTLPRGKMFICDVGFQAEKKISVAVGKEKSNFGYFVICRSEIIERTD